MVGNHDEEEDDDGDDDDGEVEDKGGLDKLRENGSKPFQLSKECNLGAWTNRLSRMMKNLILNHNSKNLIKKLVWKKFRKAV